MLFCLHIPFRREVPRYLPSEFHSEQNSSISWPDVLHSLQKCFNNKAFILYFEQKLPKFCTQCQSKHMIHCFSAEQWSLCISAALLFWMSDFTSVVSKLALFLFYHSIHNGYYCSFPLLCTVGNWGIILFSYTQFILHLFLTNHGQSQTVSDISQNEVELH